MKTFISCVASVSIALSLVACGSDSKDDAAPASAAPVWTNTTVQGLVKTKCATSGCHVSGGQSPNLTNVAEAVFKGNDKAKKRVTVDKDMPKAPTTLSTAQLKSFTDFFAE